MNHSRQASLLAQSLGGNFVRYASATNASLCRRTMGFEPAAVSIASTSKRYLVSRSAPLQQELLRDARQVMALRGRDGIFGQRAPRPGVCAARR